MATDRRFSTGIHFRVDTTGRGGAGPAKMIREVCVYCTGMVARDDNDTKWDATISKETGVVDTTANPYELDMSDAAYTFTDANIHEYLTLYGISGTDYEIEQMEGVVKILDVDEASQILKVDIKQGIHTSGFVDGKTDFHYRHWDMSDTYIPEDNKWCVLRGTASWGDFDVKIEVPASGGQSSCIPKFGGGPVTSSPDNYWDDVNHIWVGTAHTAQKSPDITGIDFLTEGIFFLRASKDFVIGSWFSTTFGWYGQTIENHIRPVVFGFGEFERDAMNSSATIDPKPFIVFNGAGYPGYLNAMIGPEYSQNGTLWNGGLWVRADGNGSVVVLFALHVCDGHGNGVNRLKQGSSMTWIERGEELMPGVEIDLICRTSGHWETPRGHLKFCRYTGASLRNYTPFGLNNSWMLLVGGIVTEWNGSLCPVNV